MALGAKYWNISPRYRVLSPLSGQPYPKGGYGFDKDGVTARMTANGLTPSSRFQSYWPADGTTRKRMDYSCWQEFKEICDDVRAAENASAFNWSQAISTGSAGPIEYRNDCAAAWEYWAVDCHIYSEGIVTYNDDYCETWSECWEKRAQHKSSVPWNYSRCYLSTDFDGDDYDIYRARAEYIIHSSGTLPPNATLRCKLYYIDYYDDIGTDWGLQAGVSTTPDDWDGITWKTTIPKGDLPGLDTFFWMNIPGIDLSVDQYLFFRCSTDETDPGAPDTVGLDDGLKLGTTAGGIEFRVYVDDSSSIGPNA